MQAKMERIYNYFVEIGLLDELGFEKDIYAIVKNSESASYIEINKEIDNLVDKYTQKLKNNNLIGWNIQYINGNNENVDQLLENEKLKQFDFTEFIIGKLKQIIQKYTYVDHGVGFYSQSNNSDENFTVQVINVEQNFKKIQRCKQNILLPLLKERDILVRLSEASLIETYSMHVCLFDYKEITSVALQLDPDILNDNELSALQKAYTNINHELYSRKNALRGIVDESMGKKEKIEIMNETKKRILNILGEYKKTDEKCNIAYKNFEYYFSDEILQILNDYDFNYINNNSYELLEKLIEIIIMLRNEYKTKDVNNKLKKLSRYKQQYQEILDWFEIEDESTFHIHYKIDHMSNIARNSVFSYVITFFKRYYNIDRSNTMELLKTFFSKANNLKDTRFAEKEYNDITKYDYKEDTSICLYKMNFLYPIISLD